MELKWDSTICSTQIVASNLNSFSQWNDNNFFNCSIFAFIFGITEYSFFFDWNGCCRAIYFTYRFIHFIWIELTQTLGCSIILGPVQNIIRGTHYERKIAEIEHTYTNIRTHRHLDYRWNLSKCLRHKETKTGTKEKKQKNTLLWSIYWEKQKWRHKW